MDTKTGDFPPCPFGTVDANDLNDAIEHSKDSNSSINKN